MVSSMITRDALKLEIDNLPDELIEPLYVIIRALDRRETPQSSQEDWHDFINKTYGAMRDSPIQRWPQGEFECREEFE
jgi:hypothetical protein